MKKLYLLIILCFFICITYSQPMVLESTNEFPPGTVYIGNVSSNHTVLNAPIAVAWENGIAQTIYHEHEINQIGLITDIILTFWGNAAGNAPANAIYHFYFGITDKLVFLNSYLDWVPYDDFTLVYTGTLPLNGKTGRHEILIPLDVPYTYTGGNLVLMGYRQHFNAWADGNRWIHTSTADIDHGRSISKVSADNIYNPPFDTYPQGNIEYSYANLGLVFNVNTTGNLSGVVTTGTPPEPLSGVIITLQGTNRTVITDYSGYYFMNYIDNGIIGITASKVGYLDYSYENIEIVINETTDHSFEMLPTSTITVSGRVIGSDTDLPVAYATVQITGYDTFPEVKTNISGVFTVPDVFTNQSYTIIVNAEGYQESFFDIEIENTDFDAGDLFAYEIAYPPSFLEAEIVAGYVYLTWSLPLRGFEYFTLYRALHDDHTDPSSWEIIATNLTALFYNDYTWNDLDGGIYRYLITAMYTNNNESEPAVSNILRHLPPGNVFIGNIESEIPGYVPFNYSYHASLAQVIYLEEEIKFVGTIESITYRLLAAGNVPTNINHKVWMAITEEDIFTSESSWVPYDDFVLVYEGLLPTNVPGVYEVVIELDTPFDYTSGNLVIMTQRFSVGTWQSGNYWQHTLTAGAYRSLQLYRDNAADYNPEQLPDGRLEFTVPNIILGFAISSTGHLSGVVTDESGNHLDEVEIHLIGTERRVYTNPEGEYFLPYIPVGVIGISAIKYGYLDTVIENIEIISGVTKTENIVLTARPEVEVSGRILSSNTGTGISGANITFSGYEDYQVESNADGSFNLAIFGNNVYTMIIRQTGYESYIDSSFEVFDINKNIGDIILYERALPVRNLIAKDESSHVKITWDAPGAIENNWFTHVQSNPLHSHIGVGMPAIMIKAHRYTQSQLQQIGVSGAEITKIQFVPRFVDAIVSTTVQIYHGGSAMPLSPGTLIYSQDVIEPLVENWVEVVLNRPIRIPDTGELWIAVQYIVLGGTPMGTDAGPAVNGYGNIMFHPSLGWAALLDLNPTLNYNFSIRAFAEGAHSHSVLSIAPIAPPISEGANREFRDSSRSLPSISILYGTPSAVPSSQWDPNRSYSPRDLIGYNIYRANYLDATNPELWTTVVTGLTDTEYEDTEWNSLSPGGYNYIVKAVYTGDNMSDPRFSNILSLNNTSQLTLHISTTNSGSINGALVKLENNSGDFNHIYQQNATSDSVIFNDVWFGDYTLTITHKDYMTSVNNSLSIENPIMTHYLTLVHTNTVIDVDFQSPPYPPDGWTMIDADGDDFCWILTNWQGSADTPPPTEWYTASESAWNYISWIPLTPDNYLVTNSFKIEQGGAAMVSFLVGTISPTFPTETYSIMVSTTTPTVEAFSTVFTETLNETFGVWKQRDVIIRDFYGDNVYVAIRHHDSTDMHLVGITNFKVAVSEAPPVLLPPKSINAVYDGVSEVYVTWEAPDNATPSGYILYKNDVLLEDMITSTEFFDTISETGYYTYSVRSVYTIGISELISSETIHCIVDERDDVIVLQTSLKGNFPNPFNPVTTISFELKNDGDVKIEIYNIRGQKVKTVADDYFKAGMHSIDWNGTDDNQRNVSSGVYFYQMKAGEFSDIKRMLLMK